MAVGVLFGGPSGERRISVLSGMEVFRDLAGRDPKTRVLLLDGAARWWISPAECPADELEEQVRPLAANDSALVELGTALEFFAWLGPFSVAEVLAALGRERIDLVFNTLHGHPGEDGSLDALFAWAGIDYVGAGPAASAMALDKIHFKSFLDAAGLPTAPWCRIDRDDWRRDPRNELDRIASSVGWPCILKTAESGSSVGVVLATSAEEAELRLNELLHFSSKVLAEARVSGREVTAPILGPAEKSAPKQLSLVEVRPLSSTWFDHEAKYSDHGAEEICPAPIDKELTRDVQALALACHLGLGVHGLSRTDFILGPEGPVILELNTLPGMTRRSLAPLAAEHSGLGFSGLLDAMIELARSRPPLWERPVSKLHD